MKIGMRKPSLKKSFKARTTGKAKRAIKKAIIPGYGKKGMGWIKNPKKAAYNKIYHKTTFGVNDIIRVASSTSSKGKKNENYKVNYDNKNESSAVKLRNSILELEKILGVDTSAKNIPNCCVYAGIFFVILGIFILPLLPLLAIGLILEITSLVLMCKRSYWNAYRWNRAIAMYIKNDYLRSKMYLDKLSKLEKESEAYKKMLNLLNGYSEEAELDYQITSMPNDLNKINKEDNIIVESNIELEIYNKVKQILEKNNRDTKYLKLRHTGVYTDICASHVLLRIKLNGKKQYILSNVENEELEKYGLILEETSKSENYKNRIKFTSVDSIDYLDSYIIQKFDKCME